MRLPEVVRNTVYRMYFAPKGLTELTTPIVVDGKRTIDKAPFSKSFADGSKNRVGLLAVSKAVRTVEPIALWLSPLTSSQINAEAVPVLYSHPLRFESTLLLGEFLVENCSTRVHITNIEVKAFRKGARMPLTLLAESPKLRRLQFEVGVTTEADPRKAARAFYLDAAQLLDAIGKQKQDKDAGVDIIEFAKGSLTTKGDKTKNYTEEMVEEFVESLKKLCK